MKHFRDEEWVDYVRGFSPEPQRAAIERCLGEGCCQLCLTLFDFWRTAVEVGVRSSAYGVPDEAVEGAAAAYAIWSRRYRLQTTARKARRLFDSFLRPAATGVRGSAVGSRRLLERSGRWMIDLRLESEGNDLVSMVGQVLQSGEQTGWSRAGEVIVMGGDDIFSRTDANQFNEFQLQFAAAQNLRLYVEIQGERPIVIELPAAIETNSADSESSALDSE